jgi:hypothetical protein
MERRDHRIDTFDPLLRDLVEWGLAIKVRARGVSSWQLTESAQKRLNEIIHPVGPLSAERLIYLDHCCADCRLRVRTRLHEGLYLCEACLAMRLAETEALVNVGKRWLWHRHRDAKRSTPPPRGKAG